MPRKANDADMHALLRLMEQNTISDTGIGGKALTFGFNSAVEGATRGVTRRDRSGVRCQNPLPGVCCMLAPDALARPTLPAEVSTSVASLLSARCADRRPGNDQAAAR